MNDNGKVKNLEYPVRRSTRLFRVQQRQTFSSTSNPIATRRGRLSKTRGCLLLVHSGNRTVTYCAVFMICIPLDPSTLERRLRRLDNNQR